MINKKTKICPACNTVVPSLAKFCPNCGTKVPEKEEIVNTIGEERNNYTSTSYDKLQEDAPKTRTRKKQGMPPTIRTTLIALLTFILGGSMMYAFVAFLPPKTVSQDIVTSHKNVNIDDTGIAESVAKVYDAVIVVENYSQNQLSVTGTGFVFKVDGDKAYIMTNNHVIAGGDSIKVKFTDNREEEAKVIGADTYSDIAVLSIDKSKIISVADIGSSKDMRVGDTTFAVGAPLDYQVYSWSVTRGIISGKDRLVEVSLSGNGTSDYVMNVLQTDTAINNGNSGGPLCNANGEVIGITNMKLASDSIEGMGFAIPIETALEYANSFISGEQVKRPYLGVGMYDLSAMTSGFFRPNINTTLTEGIYISSVEQDSPADKAGLQEGDIITKIEDISVSSSAYFRYQLYTHKVGDTITLTFYRNNEEKTTKVTLGSSDKIA